MQITFKAISEATPGEKWRKLFDTHWRAYQDWFLREGDSARPSYLETIRNFKQFIPELLPIYEKLCELAGGGDVASRFLGMYRPPPYLSGCSQAVWTDEDRFLVRNYDYSPHQMEGTIWHSRWNGGGVIAMVDCLWGVLDGINEAGLAVSLTFGGRRRVGNGFGVPLVLRYVLEFCSTTGEAVEVLKRVPVHMAYNITVLDCAGEFRTVFLCPGERAVVRQIPATTNHQKRIEWKQHAAATATLRREQFLFQQLGDVELSPQGFVAGFLEPPLYSDQYRRGFGTLYGAVYRPEHRSAEFFWPHRSWQQSIARFKEGSVQIHYRDRSDGAAAAQIPGPIH